MLSVATRVRRYAVSSSASRSQERATNQGRSTALSSSASRLPKMASSECTDSLNVTAGALSSTTSTGCALNRVVADKRRCVTARATPDQGQKQAEDQGHGWVLGAGSSLRDRGAEASSAPPPPSAPSMASSAGGSAEGGGTRAACMWRIKIAPSSCEVVFAST